MLTFFGFFLQITVKEKTMNEEQKGDGTTYKDFKLRSVKIVTKNGGEFHSLFADNWYQREVAGFAIYDSPGV
jgi:hypothetical protein